MQETVRSKLIEQCRAMIAQLESPKHSAEGVELEFFGEEYSVDAKTLEEEPLF